MTHAIDDVLALQLANRWVLDGFRPGVVQALMEEGFSAKVARDKVLDLVERDLMRCETPAYAWPTREGLALLRSTAPR